MVDKYMFEKQRDMAKEAKEYLEGKQKDAPEGSQEELAFAVKYCDECRRVSALIVDLLIADEAAKKAVKKEAPKQTVKKKAAPVKAPEPAKAPVDDLDDLF
jgi:hypothetical protein